MTLRNSTVMRVKDITPEQKEELGIEGDSGLVAVETHNSTYTTKGVVLKKGIVNYILEGN